MNSHQNQYWRDVDPNSTMTKVEHTYWITKQNVKKKIGKKDDECVVASDAELDAKLELFKSIQESCLDLQKIIDRYQERICTLAQEENSMGRFLKEAGKSDKTRAGKMMSTVGKSLCYSGQQRLTLRSPLLRLYQEVDTFRQRAIADTSSNLKSMEKRRVEYRAALSWMKDVSQELDPERQLDKFRKVQSQVRRSKTRFDQLKLVCLQKVDLLAASRCNMFSHALVLYHKILLQYSEKTCNTFQTIANSFKGYQHYDFCVVKELAEPSLKLSEQLNGKEGETSEEGEKKEQDEKDILLFFDSEYHDEIDEKTKFTTEATNATDQLLELENLNLLNTDSTPQNFNMLTQSNTQTTDDLASLDLTLKNLDDIFSDSAPESSTFGQQWDDVFGKKVESPAKESLLFDFLTESGTKAGGDVTSKCLPSMLLSQFNDSGTQSLLDGLDLTPKSVKTPTQGSSKRPFGFNLKKNEKKEGNEKDMSNWFNLFADLDPLADPDSIGVKSITDRNC